MIHLVFRIANFGRSLRGQGGPIKGSEVLNATIHMEAGHPRENLKVRNSKTPNNQSPSASKAYGPLLTISSSKQ